MNHFTTLDRLLTVAVKIIFIFFILYFSNIKSVCFTNHINQMNNSRIFTNKNALILMAILICCLAVWLQYHPKYQPIQPVTDRFEKSLDSVIRVDSIRAVTNH